MILVWYFYSWKFFSHPWIIYFHELFLFSTGGHSRIKRDAPQFRRRFKQRPMPKVYAYLRKVPIQRQYLVSYPYGVGGNTLLDQLLGNINFDNWLVTSILSYFSARYFIEIISNSLRSTTILSDLFWPLSEFLRCWGWLSKHLQPSPADQVVIVLVIDF